MCVVEQSANKLRRKSCRLFVYIMYAKAEFFARYLFFFYRSVRKIRYDTYGIIAGVPLRAIIDIALNIYIELMRFPNC